MSDVRCPACDRETPSGRRFCANCGAALAASCPACGAELVAGKPFCADCGARVSSSGAPAEAPPASHPQQAAERRLCSVLFVDLVGFTPLAEKADPEDVRELLERYFQRAERLIATYGGTVEKFIGDAVVAVWGAPTANEDDAERATRAALDVVAAVAALGREVGREGLCARAAIVTGEIAVTVGKVSEGMLAGDTVNSASRLQGAAEPGCVLVDEATWRASSGAIAYAEAGSLALKGKSEPTPAWRALRVVAQRKGLGRAEGLEPPFVGREDELRMVKDLLHATAREGRSRLVSITGVAGIGKSRLAWEFLKYVDGLAEVVYWHQGRSANYGSGVTFGALGEMVRMRAGIDETESAEVTRSKLHESIVEYVADEGERRWLEPRLAHLLGVNDAPSGDREELFSAWRTFFQSIALRGPTVLVFEDLQWADMGLMDFIESLLEWSRGYPIMVVTLARPELRELRPGWGTSQANFTSLHLDALSDDAMTELLKGFVAGLPAHIVDQVRERAEGVPLYAVETVRMLVDRGVLVEEAGGYVVRGELGTLDLPETLQALVTSRLDALPADEHRLLQDAAVLGTTFHPGALAAILGVERTALDPQLQSLGRKEFLRLETDPRSPGRGQYHFVQGVVAEVALSMLSRRDRSARHLAAAKFFEAMQDEELTDIVAAQYASAHRAAPESPDQDELAATAARWLRRAGDRALSLGSTEQAIDFYEQALDVSASPAERAELLEAAGDAAMLAAQFTRSIALLEAAVAAFGERADRNGVARASARLAFTLCLQRKYSEGLAIAEAAYLELGETGEPGVRAQLANVIATAYGNGLDLHKAIEWSEVALEVGEQLETDDQFAEAVASRGVALFSLGRHRESLMLAQGLAALADRNGMLKEKSRALMTWALCSMADDPPASRSMLRDAAEVAERVGIRALQYNSMWNYAEISTYTGQLEEARRVIDQFGGRNEADEAWLQDLRVVIAAMTGDVAGARSWLESIPTDNSASAEFMQGAATKFQMAALVSLAIGDTQDALRHAERSIQADPRGINLHTAVALAGRAALWLRDVEAARRAIEAGHLVRGRWIHATLTTISAGIAALEGRREDAVRGYETAIAEYRQLECEFDECLVTIDQVLLLGAAPVPLVEKSRDVLERLGVEPFLGVLNRAAAGS